MSEQPSSNVDQEEALARVLCETYTSKVAPNRWSDVARAAIAHMREQPADDAWETPFSARSFETEHMGIKLTHDKRNCLSIQFIDGAQYYHGMSLSNENAARMAAWLSSYAAAHGYPTGHVLIKELQRKLDVYEARERADNETLHDLADHLSQKQR